MLKVIKEYKIELILIFLIALAYFALRLPSLTSQPVFADEAIYIRWSQVMRADPTLRFLPLSDGKTPLFMWILMPMLKVIHDPLLAGRLLSVLSGFGIFLGVITLSWKFFSSKAALFAGFLVAVTPYSVFFDRLALVDSMLAAFSIWSLFLALLLVKTPRMDIAMLLGYSFGGALLTKPPGFFNILVMPLSILTLEFRDRNRQWKVVRIFGFWILALAITGVMYGILKLGPNYPSLSGRNEDYVVSFDQVMQRVWDPFLPHSFDVADWFIKLITIPTILGLLWSIYLFVKQKNKIAWTVFLWALVPMLIQMAFLRTFTARYLYFSIPPFLVLAGWGISQLAAKLPKKLTYFPVVWIIVTALFVANFNLRLLSNPESVTLPQGERSGYFEDWTAGYGLKDIADYLNQMSARHTVVVGTDGSFGTLPDGLEIYLDSNRQVSVVAGNASISAQLKSAAQDNLTFFVADKKRLGATPSGMVLVKEYPKAESPDGSQDATLLFKVLP